MKNILSEIRVLRAICPPQTYKSGASYRVSAHVMRLPCEDGVLWYQNMSGEIVLLTQAEDSAVESNPALQKQLVERWFLVPQDFSERQLVDEVRAAYRVMLKPAKSIHFFLIFPTTDCNARCFYCYETGRSRKMMREETAHDVAKYIQKKCQGEPIGIRWFGGEPLYNQKAMEIIMADLRAMGVTYESEILTNGYFFDDDSVRKAKEYWNVKFIQITLDGTEEVYNRTKAYVDCTENAYLRIMRNIAAVLDAGIQLHIRLNMDAQNADDLSVLIDELAQRFGKRENLFVYIAPLRDWGAEAHPFGSIEEGVRKMSALHEKLLQLGLTSKAFINYEFPMIKCMSADDGQISIMPNGELGKCEHLSDSGFVGSIYSDALDTTRIAQYKQRKRLTPACDTCIAYPKCLLLKHCSDAQFSCSDFMNAVRLHFLQEALLNTYRAIRDEGCFKIDDDTIVYGAKA